MGTSSQQNDGPHSSQLPPGKDSQQSRPADEETVVRSNDPSAPSGQPKKPRALPTEFGRYRILRALGHGGMGVVYLAHDAQLDRDVALKVPHFDRDENPDVIERFYREARAMGTLHHPNLCPVYDVGERDGVHFLTMAFIEGQELSLLFKNVEQAARMNVVDIVRKVALALEEAHQAGLVHRDLKPSNIMINRRGEPIVMDFGLARRNRKGEAEITQTGAIVGTPAYMSPEQIEGDAHNVRPAADVYSLGVIFYQLLCRRLPFEGDVTTILAQVLTKDPRPPSHYCQVDPALESICLRAMARSPDERFASMVELVEALDAYQASPELVRARVRRRESFARAAFARGYQHDVLVAYFGTDDEPAPGSDGVGWVTTLVDNLDWRLRQLSGQSYAFSVWMDEDLASKPHFDEETAKRLHQTATVLLVVSPGWVASEWCQGPSRFLERIRGDHLLENRVFVVEHDRVEPEARPSEMANLRGIPFWKTTHDGLPQLLGFPQPKPDADAEYYARIDDLARLLHDRLKGLNVSLGKGESTPSVAVTIDLPAKPGAPECVFLAEVTDDLDSLRDEVERYLSQSGFRVFPETWYTRDADGFRSEMKSDLKDCLLFVQLLGPLAGKKPPGFENSYAKLQQDIATQNELPVMQWRDANLNLTALVDADHLSLINGLHVQAVELEQFKRDIVGRATTEKQKRESATASASSILEDHAFIFVNIERDDLPIADDLCDLLERNGYSYALPMHEGRPDEIRQDLEANLLDCDGLIVVYGEITEQWVREQLRQWRKILYRRDKPLRALAVYEGPPSEKQRLGMKLPNMQIIDCRLGMREEKVMNFLKDLAAN